MQLLLFNFCCSLTRGLFRTVTFRRFPAGSASILPATLQHLTILRNFHQGAYGNAWLDFGLDYQYQQMLIKSHKANQSWLQSPSKNPTLIITIYFMLGQLFPWMPLVEELEQLGITWIWCNWYVLFDTRDRIRQRGGVLHNSQDIDFCARGVSNFRSME